MTWLAPKVNKRIQIQVAEQTPADNGSLDRVYTTLKTVWAEIKPTSRYSSYPGIVRGVNENSQEETHKILIREVALRGLGAQFARAFASDFKNDEDINKIKNNYYLLLESGSSVKGRRFRINGMQHDEIHREYIQMYCEEIEEEGTGYGI